VPIRQFIILTGQPLAARQTSSLHEIERPLTVALRLNLALARIELF
jgi:hypothetical protein